MHVQDIEFTIELARSDASWPIAVLAETSTVRDIFFPTRLSSGHLETMGNALYSSGTQRGRPKGRTAAEMIQLKFTYYYVLEPGFHLATRKGNESQKLFGLVTIILTKHCKCLLLRRLGHTCVMCHRATSTVYIASERIINRPRFRNTSSLGDET